MKHKIIIIPVHNQLPYLKKCIDSIVENTKRFKLIIVNDGSTDNETTDWINKNLSKHHIITHNKPMGFSVACNDGIDYAMENFDFNCLCLLNSDTEIVTKNWFNRVEFEIVTHKKIGVASVVSNNANFQTIKNVTQYMKKIDEKPTLDSIFIHGYCYFMSKDLIMTIGRFDNDLFPHYGGEDDFSIKSIKAGFQNIIVGSVFIRHKGAMSYSADKRSEMTKKTLRDLMNRWGKEYVAECVELAINVQNKLNST